MGDDAKMSTKPTFFGEAHTSRLEAAAPDADVVLPGLELPEPELELELELELQPAAAAMIPVSASPQINPRTFIVSSLVLGSSNSRKTPLTEGRRAPPDCEAHHGSR